MHLSNFFFRILPSLIFLLTGYNRLVAQDINEENFTHYTKADGLSNNIINGLMQDSTGYIWITTYSGINRFNGSNFAQIHVNNDSLSLPSEQQRGLVWLDHRRLAAYSDGIHIIDTRTGETRNLFIPYPDKQLQYKFNTIRGVRSNASGDIFLLTSSGLYHFDKNYRLLFRYDHYRREEAGAVSFAFGRSMFWLDERRLIIFTTAGIYCYDTRNYTFRKMEASDCPEMKEFLSYPKGDYQFFQPKPGSFFVTTPLRDSIIYINLAGKKRMASSLPFNKGGEEFGYRSELITLSDSSFYVTGHESGFFRLRLDPQTGQITFDPKKYFPFYSCRYLLQDRDHNLWVATTKGLFRQDNSRAYVQQSTLPSWLQASYPNIVIDDIYATRDKVYVGTRGNGGLLVFDKQQLQFIRRIEFSKNKKNANNVYAIAPLNDSCLLVGTNGPLFRVNTETGAVREVALDKFTNGADWIADLWKDRQDNIWVASENIYKYDSRQNNFSIVSTGPEPYNKIQETDNIQGDDAGNIWVSGHGLLRYNVARGVFDKLIDSFPFIKFPDRRVSSFVADHRNNLWITSYNNGLVCYNIDKGITHHFTKSDGLPDNNIAAMIVLGNKLWIATCSGIACLDVQTFRITSFEKEDGFPDLTVAIGAKFFYDVERNKLLIGFSNTIVQFDPDIIFKKSQVPRFFIESLATGDQKEIVYPGKNITTTWRNNEIGVTIGCINFFTSSSQRFAYRILKDDSTHWQPLGTQNCFTISSLPAGYNRIQVKLFSLDNRWPDQVKEIDITVLPPFWQQKWFLTLSTLLLLLGVYLLLKWRIGLTRKKEQAKTHIQKLKADEYKNQFELEQISHYFSSSLANKKNVEEILWDVAKNLIGRMKYVDCMIYLWDKDRTRMIPKASYGPNPISDARAVLPGQGVVGHVMKTWKPLLIPNTRQDKRYRMGALLCLSEICVPIIHNNELIGIIDSEHDSVYYYKDRDLKILTTIATLVGNKIKEIESEQFLEIKQKEIAYINQQLAEAQLSALQTQMNPHFIFNSLNSIKGMILENEQQKASRYLSKFAHMIRTTLNQSKEIFTTLCENIEHLESYLLMEKLRFDDSFTFRITVDEHIDQEEILIPTLMIQPLAENAIWHGLMRKEGEKKLSIRFSRLGETISCTIMDNGIGLRRSEQLKQLNRSPHQSVGLSNLRNRIKIMNEKYDTGCTLEITDIKDFNPDKTGTRAILRFNVITNKPSV